MIQVNIIAFCLVGHDNWMNWKIIAILSALKIHKLNCQNRKLI